MDVAAPQGPAELGRLLASARGYRVFAHGGAPLGVVEHVRYEQQVSRPDEIVLCARSFLRRRRRSMLPFSAVAAINVRESTVVLRPDSA